MSPITGNGITNQILGVNMTDFTDSNVFNYTQQSPMEPCTEPTAEAFENDQDTLIWSNISGEMRLYSYDGVNVQYQVVQLSAKTNV